MDIYSQIFTVTVPDVGENNRLTNRGILRILQEVACLHSNAVGFSVNESTATGFAWIILNWKLQVFERPTWNSKLIVSTWPTKHSLLSFYRDFEILDENNNLVAIATSKWVLYDLNKGSVVKINDEITSRYAEVHKNVFDESMTEKLKEPTNSTLSCQIHVGKRDIDTNHHVNNLSYLAFAYEAIPNDIFFNSDFRNVEIMYKHEAKFNDNLKLYYANVDNSHFVTIKNATDDKLHCIVKLY